MDGKSQGLLPAMIGPSLTLDDLRSVPREAQMGWLIRLDALRLYQQIKQISAAISPSNDLEKSIAQLEQIFGINWEDDLLKPLGDRWALYSSPAGAPAGRVR